MSQQRLQIRTNVGISTSSFTACISAAPSAATQTLALNTCKPWPLADSFLSWDQQGSTQALGTMQFKLAQVEIHFSLLEP